MCLTTVRIQIQNRYIILVVVPSHKVMTLCFSFAPKGKYCASWCQVE